jgi:2'-5' RNA ligase
VLQKYFIAIIPPEPVYSEIELIKKDVSVKYSNKSALRSPPHITLHMPFEYKTEKEAVLFSALESFSFTDQFTIHLHNFSCFEPKVVFIDVMPNETLSNLQSSLVQHIKVNLNIFNQAEALRGFHPHITIAFRDLKKTSFYEMMAEYKEKQFTANFKVSSFFLLKHTGKHWLPYKEFKFKA